MKYSALQVAFSTADADQPVITFRGDDLLLDFIDWQEKQVSIRFPDAVAFKWEMETRLPHEIRDDTSYEVLESSWVNELNELGAVQSNHRHYKLCFNACGVLDVISLEMSIH